MTWRSAVVMFTAAAILAFPSASAQSPVSGCTRECAPKDADVNGPHTKTDGPVKILLYVDGRNGTFLEPLVPGPDARDVRRLLALQYLESREVGMASFSPFVFERGRPYHHTQGFAAPLRPTAPVVAYVYVSTETRGPLGVELPGAAPLIALESRIRAGTETLAEGSSGPGLLVAHVGGQPVYEFRIPMNLRRTAWADGADHDVRIGWYLAVRPLATQPGVPAGFTTVTLHSGARFPSRLVVTLNPPAWFEGATYEVANGTGWLRLRVDNPFGPGDLNASSARLRLLAADGLLGGPFAPRMSREHFGHHPDEQRLDLAWSFVAPDAPARAVVTLRNGQDTFEVTHTVELAPASAPPLAMPAANWAFAFLATLLGAALWRRET